MGIQSNLNIRDSSPEFRLRSCANNVFRLNLVQGFFRVLFEALAIFLFDFCPHSILSLEFRSIPPESFFKAITLCSDC